MHLMVAILKGEQLSKSSSDGQFEFLPQFAISLLSHNIHANIQNLSDNQAIRFDIKLLKDIRLGNAKSHCEAIDNAQFELLR